MTALLLLNLFNLVPSYTAPGMPTELEGVIFRVLTGISQISDAPELDGVDNIFLFLVE